jgi:serine/threonine protein kinase
LPALGHWQREKFAAARRIRATNPSALTLKALSVDSVDANVILDYVLVNFRVLKALLPQSLAVYAPDTAEGVTTLVLGTTAFLTYLTTPPNVLGGLLDSVGSVTDKRAVWSPSDISRLGRALGKGTYGTAYEGYPTEEGFSKFGSRIRDQQSRIVVKKLIDLQQAEIEAYFNQRISRSGGRGYFATFLGGSQPEQKAEEAPRSASLDPRLLVWDFEGSTTLEAFMADPTFPLNLEPLYFPRAQEQDLDDKRKAVLLRRIMTEILTATKVLHNCGIVHRDIKPANILVTESPYGQVLRLIDLGACADLRNGYNYEPESGILDPRYGPPEQYIMPQSTPRPPPGLLALLAAPFLWQSQSPDLFDSYTVGMTLLQMAVPQMRGIGGTKLVNQQLKNCNNDAEAWRLQYGRQMDFDLLDRQNGAGWDLVCKLLTPKKSRLSVSAALAHRFFRPDGLSSVGIQPSGSKTVERTGNALTRK